MVTARTACQHRIVTRIPSSTTNSAFGPRLVGFDVVGEAADGADALDAAARLRPDVVLLDVQLPDIDGFEIAARLALTSDSPTVVLTSSRDAGDFGDLVARSGARGFIPKAELSGPTLAALLD
jgi:DNA-binding NarL/FixJ family response regulator